MSSSFTKKEFNDDFRRLYYAALDAKRAYQIWWLFINKDERPKYGTVLKHYMHFFSPSIHAHFVAMLMALCKIYDKNYGKNLKKFIKLSNEASFIKTDVIKEIENQISSVVPIIGKLHTLRNNYYAHIQLDGEAVYKIVGIKPNDFRDIIGLTIDLLDKIAISSNKGKFSFEFNSVPTTYRLLDVLKKDLAK